jgi:hypothetical protein
VLDKNNEAEERKVSLQMAPFDVRLSVQISVIVEFVAGKVNDMLMKMIALYRPDCKYYSISVDCSQLIHSPYRWHTRKVKASELGNGPWWYVSFPMCIQTYI